MEIKSGSFCYICQDSYNRKDILHDQPFTIQCEHTFHRYCILKWIYRSRGCNTNDEIVRTSLSINESNQLSKLQIECPICRNSPVCVLTIREWYEILKDALYAPRRIYTRWSDPEYKSRHSPSASEMHSSHPEVLELKLYSYTDGILDMIRYGKANNFSFNTSNYSECKSELLQQAVWSYQPWKVIELLLDCGANPDGAKYFNARTPRLYLEKDFYSKDFSEWEKRSGYIKPPVSFRDHTTLSTEVSGPTDEEIKQRMNTFVDSINKPIIHKETTGFDEMGKKVMTNIDDIKRAIISKQIPALLVSIIEWDRHVVICGKDLLEIAIDNSSDDDMEIVKMVASIPSFHPVHTRVTGSFYFGVGHVDYAMKSGKFKIADYLKVLRNRFD